MTFSGLCRFVIADLIFPKSFGHESASTIPIQKVPFVPLIEIPEEPYSMFTDMWENDWVMDLVEYKDIPDLLDCMDEFVIKPVEKQYKKASKRRGKVRRARVIALPKRVKKKAISKA